MGTLHELLLQAKGKPDEKVAETKGRAVELDAQGVAKLASLMEAKGGDLMKTAATVVRRLQSEKEYLVEELARHMHKESAAKFARELVEHGVCQEKDLPEMIEKVAKIGSLGPVRQALDLVQPKKSLSIGQVDKSASDEPRTAGDRKLMEDPAVAFLLSNR